MYLVRFSSLRAYEHHDPRVFERRVSNWLVFREAENCYLLGHLPALLTRVAQLPPEARIPERMFTVEEEGTLLSAGILFPNGCLLMTWATEAVAETLVEFLAGAGCAIFSVFAPGYFSWKFAEKWAQLTHQQVEFGPSERIYQLAQCSFAAPPTGRLELAGPADKDFLRAWVAAFVQESRYETALSHEDLLEGLIHHQMLYLWKDPAPVSMAAWMSPTLNGGSINFVYTPPHLRRKGHARSVVTALGALMLSRGRKYCFILTDAEDVRTNSLYQALGATTQCELMRCSIRPRVAEPARMVLPNRWPQAGRIAL